MNPKQYLILIKSGDNLEDKTDKIESIKDSGEIYVINFKGNPKPYSYKKLRIKFFTTPIILDSNKLIIKAKYGRLKRWNLAVDFGPYVKFFSDKNEFFKEKEALEIKPDISCEENTKQLLTYYRNIVNILSQNSAHLKIYYENKLNKIRSDSVLANFITGTAPNPNESTADLIFPFGTNPSQRIAIQNALYSQISIIQGPPGTGKTQTILNIISNLIVQNKTVAIVAGNNSATGNVYEKLEKEGFEFLAARLGNNDLQEKFFNSSHQLPDIGQWHLSTEEAISKKSHLTRLNKEIAELLEAKNKLAEKKESYSRLTLEKEVFKRHFPVEPINPEKYSFYNRWSTPNLLSFLAEFEYHSEKQAISIPLKLRWLFKYKLYRFKDLKNLDTQSSKGLALEYYERKQLELHQEIENIESILNERNFDTLLQRHTRISLQILRHAIAERFKNSTHVDLELSNYKLHFLDFTKRFPVTLSTTDSIINNKDNLELFDYIIVDEASQVDLLTGILSMATAKNIVAVGDLNQLPHIPDRKISKECKELDDKFNIQPGYSYKTESLLSSLNTVFSDSAPTVLLKEHYRCHPRIIDFCNQKFYNGQLVIMTESSNEAFKIFKTVEGNHQRRPAEGKSLLNQRELDVISNEIIEKFFTDAVNNDVGITTPYRAQAIRARDLFDQSDIQIDTVYKYQGREKKIIIFSTTATYLNKFADDPNLLNVAVSRAKEQFILVTSPNSFKRHGSNIGDLIRHIEYQSLSENIFQSRIVSIFDCLYKEYSIVLKDFYKNKKSVSKYESENLMSTLLDNIIEDTRFNSLEYRLNYSLSLLIKDETRLNNREFSFKSHPNTHIDFVLFNKLDKSAVLAIEVDGYRFHENNKKQKERDSIKNSILEKIGLRLIRFSTIGSDEETILKNELNSIITVAPESQEEQISSNFSSSTG